MKDLLHPLDQPLLLKRATGTNDKALSTLHAVNIQAGGDTVALSIATSEPTRYRVVVLTSWDRGQRENSAIGRYQDAENTSSG